MIDYERFSRIHDCHENRHLTVPQIARELGLHRCTVSKWLLRAKYGPHRPPARPSKLDPWKREIVRWLEVHPYTATQVFLRLREAGFSGGITIVKDYVQKVRPHHAPAFLTLAFAPGECAQVDWGQHGSIAVGNTRRRLSFFVMVLCYSRMLYVEFTLSETMEHFLACHQNAFEFLGGIPVKVMADNLKSAVLRRALGETPVLNPAAKEWLRAVANVRLHGTVKQKPADLFQTEKPALRPIPLIPYDVGVIRPVRATSRFRVTLDTNTYSVPAEYASARLTLKVYPDHLCVYHEQKLIARHLRSYDRHQDFENPDHPRELLQQRRRASEQKLLLRLLALSPKAEAFYRELQDRRLNVLHHVRKIVALSEIYGTDATARALEDAFEFQAFRCEYIANLLEQRQRRLPEPGALHLTRRQDLLDLELPQPDLDLYDADDSQAPQDPGEKHEPEQGPSENA